MKSRKQIPKTKVRCKYCGIEDLHWVKAADDQWFLADDQEKQHECNKIFTLTTREKFRYEVAGEILCSLLNGNHGSRQSADKRYAQLVNTAVDMADLLLQRLEGAPTNSERTLV